MTTLTLGVEGSPAPQGSKRAYVVKGRAVLIEDNKRTKPWRAAITLTARVEANRQKWTTTDQPVELDVTFLIPKPATSRRAYPSVKPDLDKLLRALLDGLTDANIWKDDSQVVSLIARKVYVLTKPGILATINTVGEPPHGSKQ